MISIIIHLQHLSPEFTVQVWLFTMDWICPRETYKTYDFEYHLLHLDCEVIIQLSRRVDLRISILV